MKEKLVLQKIPIWERQPGETIHQYLWFTRYKDERLNGGSMSDVCKKYDKREGYSRVLNNWAGPNRWTERIMAYQDFLEHERAKQRLKAIEEMDERQAKNGVLLQQQGILFFQQNAADLRLSAEQAMRYIEVGSRIERTARGVPTEIRAESELPEETRKRMEALYAEAMDADGEVIPENVLSQSSGEEEREEEEV